MPVQQKCNRSFVTHQNHVHGEGHLTHGLLPIWSPLPEEKSIGRGSENEPVRSPIRCSSHWPLQAFQVSQWNGQTGDCKFCEHFGTRYLPVFYLVFNSFFMSFFLCVCVCGVKGWVVNASSQRMKRILFESLPHLVRFELLWKGFTWFFISSHLAV